MAISNNSFLVLEESLTDKIYNSWVKKNAREISSIAIAATSGNFSEAYRLVNKIDLTQAVESNTKFIELIGMSAILFGASKFSTAKKTSFAGKTKPDLLRKAVLSLKRMMVENGNNQIRKSAYKLISDEENKQKTNLIYKAEGEKSFAKKFVSTVNSKGKNEINIGSSLHTSRLSAWGFTVEADLLGQTSYKVNEQIDGRVCPVCRRMHGKVFQTQQAKQKLEGLLAVEDPADLKELAPWPKQDPGSLQRLDNMSNDEIASAGWDTPPYHPRCRGLLVKAAEELPNIIDRDIDTPDQPAINFRTFNKDDEAANWGHGKYAQLKQTQSTDSIKAIKSYQLNAYKDINRLLRKGEASIDAAGVIDAKNNIKHIDSVLRSSTINENITVYRGIQSTSKTFGAAADQKLIGTVFQDKGFMSTSLRPKAAIDFAEGLDGSALIEIRVAKGTHGTYPQAVVHGESQFNVLHDEFEVLLARGQKFKVVEVVQHPSWSQIRAKIVVEQVSDDFQTIAVKALSDDAIDNNDGKFSWGEGDIIILERPTK